MSTDAIIAGALDLPLEERKKLARLLYASIDASPEQLSDDQWEQAWGPVIAKRLDEVRSGRTDTTPAADVFDRVTRKYGGA